MFVDENRPLILVTNDDGVDAKGIGCLVETLRGLGRIVVVAPDSVRSGRYYHSGSTRTIRLFPREVIQTREGKGHGYD